MIKIIIEGTAEELSSAIGSFGIPNEIVIDDGEKFVPFACGDLAGKNHRASKDNAIVEAQVTSRRTFKHLKKAIRNGEIDFSYKPDTKPIIDLNIMAEAVHSSAQMLNPQHYLCKEEGKLIA